MSFLSRIGWALAFLFSVQAQADTEMPEQLSFDVAMKIVDEANHYSALLLKADYETLQSELLNVEGLDDYSLNLNLQAQYVDPSIVETTEVSDDHRLSILLEKNLLDGGFSNKKQQSVASRLEAAKYLIQHMRLSKRVEVARKFFDIQLSDLKFSIDNEAISTAYIKFHKTEERNELKQQSDVELLKAQFEYQQVRARRYESETMQRISRARFAESISRPNELPSEVILPDLTYIEKKRPDYEQYLKQVMANNLQLRMQQKMIEAANKELEASRSQHGARLSTELEWSEYSNELPSKNTWRAALKYTLPLYSNDRAKSSVAQALAALKKQQAIMSRLEGEVRQQSLELWQRLYVLKARQDIDEVAEEYRELSQDRSRAFYEMEFKTNLGDSFVRVSEARHEKFKNNFELAVTWIKLAMLTGQTLEEFLQQ